MLLFEKIYLKLMPMKKYPTYLRKKGAVIGNNCYINKSVSFGSEPYLIKLGDHVRITSGVQLVTHDGAVWVLRGRDSCDEFNDADCFGRIVIENNVHIGKNAIIMPGVYIGRNSIIGCGSVVTHNIPSDSVAVGVPARVIETIDEYANKMRLKCVSTKHMSPKDKQRYLTSTVLDEGKMEDE